MATLRLTRNPWLVLCWVWGTSLVCIAISYFWQGYRDGYWWPANYIYSIAIPIALLASIVWMMFVPRQLELSDTSLVIQYPLRSIHVTEWSKLKCWGRGNGGILLLQFTTGKTFQIALFAFPRKQRRRLTDFVNKRFPERKAHIWLATKGSRWK